jgi:hypothetical protein
MKRRILNNFLALALIGALPCAPAAAQAPSPWQATVHVGLAEVDRLVRDDGAWWTRVDDRKTAPGLSFSYDVTPLLRVRAMYERATDLAAGNVCPPGATCPAVVIRGRSDFSAWQLAAMPCYRLSRDWALFGTLGAMYWKLDRDDVLPGDSGTELVYGAGIRWRATGDVELGLEYQHAGVDYDALRLNVGIRF